MQTAQMPMPPLEGFTEEEEDEEKEELMEEVAAEEVVEEVTVEEQVEEEPPEVICISFGEESAPSGSLVIDELASPDRPGLPKGIPFEIHMSLPTSNKLQFF